MNFADQLRALGYAVEQVAEDRIVFPYIPQVGKFRGTSIVLGLLLNNDFPANSPAGPHIKPRLLPLKSGGAHPDGGIHDSPFGPEWEYWSRPFPNWNESSKTVEIYMEHIHRLFDQ
jgi:hypothetical protein